jgi:uncharacterized protein
MTKPVGPICNLDCKYCFYLEKESLYPGKANWRMPEDVLERYVRSYIESQETPEVTFAWQGGEPTLMGVEFFRRVVELQRQYAYGKKVGNTFQTNGTLIDDEWGAFLGEHNFLVGLSIDGPRQYHDKYRVDKQGQPTFDAVMRGMGVLKRHGVEFNTLCVVNRFNSKAPLEVYNFLKNEGSGYIQFIPLVERAGPTEQMFAEPPLLPILGQDVGGVSEDATAAVTPWSVESEQYGKFLCEIFDHWVRNDVGKVFVQIFDVQLGIWMGMPSSLCVFMETCGNAMAMEHNGDLYSCDHYVYPRYKLGNILDHEMGEMAASAAQRKFGEDKRDALPKYCRECDVRFACNGECPKHRFLKTPDGEMGLNYLCAGYKRFFMHVDPYMQTMGRLLNAGYPAAEIMNIIREEESRPRGVGRGEPGRNDPCPCGSGKKYKKCCLAKA